MNFVSCVAWVKQGVAKAQPDKVALSKEELQKVINATKNDLADLEEIEAGLSENEDGCNDMTKVKPEREEENTASLEDTADSVSISKKEENVVKENDPYDLENYDKDEKGVDTLMGIGRLTLYSSNEDDPYVTLRDDDDKDSEAGDYEIKPTDDLILVGHVMKDSSVLEVYVYNEEETHLYVHHDILLPSLALCIEWLNFDTAEDIPGNFAAIGMMSPVIEVWDIDTVDCLEPAFKLGKRRKKKKGEPGYGHQDAVLSLSWNRDFRHIIASGSVDQTVLLWDLATCQVATTITDHTEKVQTLQWHPFQSDTLLTGCCDKQARVFDCRLEGEPKVWQLSGEIERVQWDHFNSSYFLASTDVGMVHYIDIRTSKPLWELKAHTDTCTGITLSSQCPGCLVTVGFDHQTKIWDIYTGKPEFVSSMDFKIGTMHCVAACPDAPFVVALGGEKKDENFRVWDIRWQNSVYERFNSRQLCTPVVPKKEPDMDMEDGATSGIENIKLESNVEQKKVTKPKKQKQLKKLASASSSSVVKLPKKNKTKKFKHKTH